MVTPPPNTICEGRLPEAGVGWTLCSGYATGGKRDKATSARQKTGALMRALELMGEAGNYEINAADLSFPRGAAPALLTTSALPGAQRTSNTAPVLSLAHSGNLLLAAAAGAGLSAAQTGGAPPLLGVDVEQVRSRDFQRLEAHMGWREARFLWSGIERQFSEDLLFYRRWTLAESLYKALGKVNLECFTNLERLALNGLSSEDAGGPGSKAGQGWDSGWLCADLVERRWYVRWWRVTVNEQSAMVCLLRATD